MNIRWSLSAALALAACSPQADTAPPARPPLAGARIGGPFTLTDQDGHIVSDRQFAGRYRVMYFGYTYCPDVCPTDMQNIGAGLRLLEKSDPATAAKIVPIFVTVDPERDTPPIVKQFVRAFHPRMIGLTGTPMAIDAVTKEFSVYHAKGDTSPGGGYMVNHTNQTYLMDPTGKPLALIPADQNPQAVADELKRWVR